MAQNNSQTVTIKDVVDDGDFMRDLSNLMDNYFKKNHIRFVEWLIQNKKIQKDFANKLKSLEKYFHGGGSPTMAFLNAIAAKNSNDLVKKLKDFASTKNYEALIVTLNENKIDDNWFIKDLEDSVKLQIADHLDPYKPGIANWEVFASHFDFNNDERNVFSEVKTIPGKFSPTKVLFEMLGHKKYFIPVELIMEWAISEGRNDISEKIGNWKLKRSQRNVNQNGTIQTNDLDELQTTVFALNMEENLPKQGSPKTSKSTDSYTDSLPPTSSTASAPDGESFVDDPARKEPITDKLPQSDADHESDIEDDIPLNEDGTPDLR